MQARERALLAQRENLTSAAEESDGQRIAPTDGAEIPAALRAQWERQGGLDEPAPSAIHGASHAGRHGAGRQVPFMDGFNALPKAATSVAYAYLAAGSGHFGSAEDADITEFVETPEGKELVAEWGSKAARHVATPGGAYGLCEKPWTRQAGKRPRRGSTGSRASQAKAMWKALVK